MLESSKLWDFTRWRPVAPDQMKAGRFEPAFSTSVLRLQHLEQRKNKELTMQFRTSGYAVDPRCPNRPCRVRRYSYLEKMPDDVLGQVQRPMTVWEAVVDLSDVGNDGKPFEVVVNAVWWNAFQDQVRGRPTDWVGFRLDYPTPVVNQAILLPSGKRRSLGAFPPSSRIRKRLALRTCRRARPSTRIGESSSGKSRIRSKIGSTASTGPGRIDSPAAASLSLRRCTGLRASGGYSRHCTKPSSA